MNELRKAVEQIYKLPEEQQIAALTKTVGGIVKYTGFSGVVYEKMSTHEVIVSLENKTAVQNHIGQIHAAAMFLLAETATGMVTAMNVPDTSVVLVKEINTKFVRRSEGSMRAVANLTDNDIQQIQTTEKGELKVPVKITDATNNEPIICDVTWAWISKSRLANKQ